MSNRLLILFPILATVTALIDVLNGADWAAYAYLVLVWALMALVIVNKANPLVRLLRWLRARPVLFWLLLVVYGVIGIGGWYARYQPVAGRLLNGEMVAFLLMLLWGWIVLFTVGWGADDRHVISSKLGQSRWTGVLITLTTMALLLLGIEGVMRLTLVQSDAFAFTIMHEQWTQLYWNPINELGFRDYPPNSDPDITHILVLGDSFASGHGVNDIDDTFPHILAHELGDGYSVNIAAEPGWDTDREMTGLAEYPVQPNIVILSYYYNDIGYALPDNPVQVTFPTPPIDWLEDHFFIASFLYWHVFQTNVGGDHTYAENLLAGYDNPDVWTRHEQNLAQIVVWSRDRQIPVIVLAWGGIRAPEVTRPAIDRVAGYFDSQNVPVVNMIDVLADEDPSTLTVNAFDDHPNAIAHRLAADALLPLIPVEE